MSLSGESPIVWYIFIKSSHCTPQIVYNCTYQLYLIKLQAAAEKERPYPNPWSLSVCDLTHIENTLKGDQGSVSWDSLGPLQSGKAFKVGKEGADDFVREMWYEEGVPLFPQKTERHIMVQGVEATLDARNGPQLTAIRNGILPTT